MIRWGLVFGVCIPLVVAACGDDESTDSETSVSNDDDCQSLCGCEGCTSSETETSGQTGSGSESASGSGSASGSTGSADGTGTTQGGSGSMICECSPEDPRFPACPEQLNCGDVNPGDECCTAEGQLLVCVQNDIGVTWMEQTEC